MLESLSDDLIQSISQCWLTIPEQRKLAMVCKRFLLTLPSPIRIRIYSFDTTEGCYCSLGGDMFVSTLNTADQEEEEKEQKDEGETLDSSSNTKATTTSIPNPMMTCLNESTCPELALKYNTPYIFWRYDTNNNQNPVFLGRHLRKEVIHGETITYIYTLGYRPNEPNQFWTLLREPTQEKELSAKHHDNDDELDLVGSSSVVTLAVEGKNSRLAQVDSSDRHFLSAKSTSSTHDGNKQWEWYASSNTSTNGSSIINNNDNNNSKKKSTHEIQIQIMCHGTLGVSRCTSGRQVVRRADTFPVHTHSIPDLCDSGYALLYSPSRWKTHLDAGNGRISKSSSSSSSNSLSGFGSAMGNIIVVEFTFWMENGIMNFQAHDLHFTLTIPILKTDRSYFHPNDNPLVNLFNGNSIRWEFIKYYMAAAADSQEGYTIDMDVFLRDFVRNEIGYIGHYDTSNEIVSISRPGAPDFEIDIDFPDIDRDDQAIWRFVFAALSA